MPVLSIKISRPKDLELMEPPVIQVLKRDVLSDRHKSKIIRQVQFCKVILRNTEMSKESKQNMV